MEKFLIELTWNMIDRFSLSSEYEALVLDDMRRTIGRDDLAMGKQI